MVAGWKYFPGNRVDITTCALGKVEDALSITPLRAVATLSCDALRSFVPVCIIMWLGEPSWSSDIRCRTPDYRPERIAGNVFFFLYIFPV